MRAKQTTKSAFLIISLLLTASTVSYGMDIDLYVLSGVNISPNVLIILDKPASLDEVDQDSGALYDPNVDYSIHNPLTVYPRYAVY